MHAIWNARNAGLLLAMLALQPGCSSSSHPSDGHGTSAKTTNEEDQEAGIHSALAKLTPADREQATAQKYCPVIEANRLGSMGEPVKVMVNNQPVFVCCKGCVRKAQQDPSKTLAKIEELKVQVKAGMSK